LDWPFSFSAPFEHPTEEMIVAQASKLIKVILNDFIAIPLK
jgi:hypothetical protein